MNKSDTFCNRVVCTFINFDIIFNEASCHKHYDCKLYANRHEELWYRDVLALGWVHPLINSMSTRAGCLHTVEFWVTIHNITLLEFPVLLNFKLVSAGDHLNKF